MCCNRDEMGDQRVDREPVHMVNAVSSDVRAGDPRTKGNDDPFLYQQQTAQNRTSSSKAKQGSKDQHAKTQKQAQQRNSASDLQPRNERPTLREMEPEDPRVQEDPVKVQARQFEEQAGAEFAKNNLEQAIYHYSNALQLDPTMVGSWAGRGGARLRMGDLGAAMEDLNEALRLEPQQILAMRDRAEVRLKQGDFNGAIDDYDRKLALAPADGRGLCGRGDAKLRKGDKQGAISDFTVASQLGYPGAKELLNRARG